MNAPRALPHRPEAEQAVLGGILLRGTEALTEASDIVTIDDFYLPTSQAVFRAMQIVEQRGEPIDVQTLLAQLGRSQQVELVGGIEGVARLDRYAAAHNIATHAKLVREAAVARDLVVYHREQANTLMDPDIEDLGEFVAASQAQHAEIAVRAHGTDGLVSIREAIADGMREVFERSKGVGACTPFGFRRIDREYGGMLPGEFWILAARTGHGKSAAAWAIARNQVLMQGDRRGRWVRRSSAKPVLYSSNEMSPASLAMRGLSEAIMVDGAAFRRPTQPWIEANRDVLKHGLGLVGLTPITFGYRPRYGIDQACADARLWARRERKAGREPAIAIFDYLQNYEPPRWLRREPRTEQIGYMSGCLKALAGELKIPILALMQLNRDTEGRPEGRPEIRDLRESGKPELDADGIGMLWRPERNHPEYAARKARLLALDARMSQPGNRLTDAEREEYSALYKAKLLAKIKFPKVRGAEADWTFDLEFLPEFTRFLDTLDQTESE
jgi:replicative DNA helicase